MADKLLELPLNWTLSTCLQL